jgi:small multidrug resistance family-3 protein
MLLIRSATFMTSVFTFVAAALLEIAGCFAFWTWLRADGSAWWVVPGLGALIGFATLLTRADVDASGRAFAAYGGVYIVTSLLWLWLVDGQRPGRWDVIGGVVCLIGAAIILMGARGRALP